MGLGDEVALKDQQLMVKPTAITTNLENEKVKYIMAGGFLFLFFYFYLYFFLFISFYFFLFLFFYFLLFWKKKILWKGTFSVVVTENNEVFTFGSGQSGNLGSGNKK